MAYQETEKTKARKEAQANLIIASAIDIIKKEGFEGLTTRALAERAGVAKGLIFHYFPDMAELIVKVEHTLMLRDVEAMRAASKEAASPLAALVAALRALFERMLSRESREMASMLNYPKGITREIEKLLRAIDPEGDNNLIARATLGVVCQLAALGGSSSKRLSTAVLFVLKGIGASAADQRKAMELV